MLLFDQIQAARAATAETAYSLQSKLAHKINDTYPSLSETTNYITSTLSSYASVIQTVDGVEREITRTPPSENLGENVIPLNDERIELVNHILDLYCKPSKECFKHYDDNVIFEDQLLYTTGLSNLKAQFYGTQKIPVKSTIINYKVLENTANVLRISLNQKYLLPFGLAFLLESEIILDFNENHKICKHTDLWYGKQLISKGEILRKGAARIVCTLVTVPSE